MYDDGAGQDKALREQAAAERVLSRNATIAAGSALLWELARGMIEHSVREGRLAPPPDAR